MVDHDSQTTVILSIEILELLGGKIANVWNADPPPGPWG